MTFNLCTPGPWTARRADNGLHCLHDAKGHHFANVRNVRSPDGAQADADARLIAAAPDMLAALEEAEPFLRSGDVDTRGGMIELSRIANKFASIIAKAKGGDA